MWKLFFAGLFTIFPLYYAYLLYGRIEPYENWLWPFFILAGAIIFIAVKTACLKNTGRYKAAPYLALGIFILMITASWRGLERAEWIQEGDLLNGVEVEEVLDHESENPKAIIFTNGHIEEKFWLEQIIRRRSKVGGPTEYRSYITPFIDENWTPDMPVHIWAYCSNEECFAKWREAWKQGNFNMCRSAFVLQHDKDYFPIISKVEKKYALNSSDDAIVIECAEENFTGMAKKATELASDTIWIIFLFWTWLCYALSREKLP